MSDSAVCSNGFVSSILLNINATKGGEGGERDKGQKKKLFYLTKINVVERVTWGFIIDDERRAEPNDRYLSHGSVISDVVVVVVVAKTVFFATLINPVAINKSTHASKPPPSTTF